MLDEDRDLLNRFRRGEREAMAQVFRLYSDNLARFLRRGFSYSSRGRPMRFNGISDRSDLHDLIMETFRRAFEERARLAYDGVSPYTPYLQTIARNLVIDRGRSKASSWISLEEAGPVDPGQPPSAAPDAQYERTELTGLMSQYTASLGEEDRSFLQIRYVERLSQEETAQRLHRSRRWVRNTEAKLRKRLLVQLKGTGYLPIEGRSESAEGRAQ